MSHTQNRNTHLTLWIETKYIITECQASTLSLCMDHVLNVFGSKQDQLRLLINTANPHQLNMIQTIIKEQIAKQTETMDISHHKQPCKYSMIPKQCIQHICSFLNCNDILQFKSTSRTTSIVCLREMRKYRISIYDATQLLNYDSVHYQCIDHEWMESQNTPRYRFKKTMTYQHILEAILCKSEIQSQEQLLVLRIKKEISPVYAPYNYHDIDDPYDEIDYYYYLQDHLNDLNTHLMDSIDTASSHLTPYYQCQYIWNDEDFNGTDCVKGDESLIVFNKQNITIFTSNEWRKMKENELYTMKQKRLLFILHYFDIHHQCLKVIDVIMIHENDLNGNIHYVLTKYIEQEVIANNMNEYKDLMDLIRTIKHDDAVPIFAFYVMYRNEAGLSDHIIDINNAVSAPSLFGKPISIVFQINPSLNPLKLETFKQTQQITLCTPIYVKLGQFLNNLTIISE